MPHCRSRRSQLTTLLIPFAGVRRSWLIATEELIMTTAASSFVVVYHARDIAQAHLIQMVLETAGIAAHIENEFLQPILGEIPCGWSTAPLVLVDESDVAAAMKVIGPIDVPAESNANVPTDVASCLACGTEMPDSETRCSICGWTYDGELV